MATTLLISVFSVALLVVGVSSHGRLVEPPSRSTMWRFGFRTPPNYNDNELFCGGFSVHWQRNEGKCGICGDAWDLPKPRPNEAGGTYGNGVIVRNYRPGEVIRSTVQITANHRGFFEFKLCPHNNPTTEVTQECLDRHPLQLADGSGTKYYPSAGTGSFDVDLRLPERITCTQCVFQWTYTAGNNWGKCANGSSKLGCGPQETFRGCADVAVGMHLSAIIPPQPVTTRRPVIPQRKVTRRPTATIRKTTPRTRKRPTTPVRKIVHRPKTTVRKVTPRPTVRKVTPRPIIRKVTPRPTVPVRKTNPRPRRPTYLRPEFDKRPPPTKKPLPTPKPKIRNKKKPLEPRCRATGVWKSISGIAPWCDANCARGYCPSTHCDCS